jgi:hypothetical protein
MRFDTLGVRALLLSLALALGGCAALGPAGPATVQTTTPPAPLALTLPNRPDSFKFAVLGDFGTASRGQYEMAAQMKRVHDAVPYELVITVGDNIYGAERQRDMERKFERPYKPLLDAGVKFYAALGNHDGRDQRYYKPFNMDGKLYYTFKGSRQSVRFFALDSTYMSADQLAWLEQELKGSREDWKIAYLHHPPYSSGDRHGSDDAMRKVLEPLFVAHNVSVVMTGHDHFYERVKPQQGIVYFVVGAGGQLRRGNLDPRSPLTAKGNDQDYSFLVCEVEGDTLHFNAVSRRGLVFDAGTITRRK